MLLFGFKFLSLSLTLISSNSYSFKSDSILSAELRSLVCRLLMLKLALELEPEPLFSMLTLCTLLALFVLPLDERGGVGIEYTDECSLCSLWTLRSLLLGSNTPTTSARRSGKRARRSLPPPLFCRIAKRGGSEIEFATVKSSDVAVSLLFLAIILTKARRFWRLYSTYKLHKPIQTAPPTDALITYGDVSFSPLLDSVFASTDGVTVGDVVAGVGLRVGARDGRKDGRGVDATLGDTVGSALRRAVLGTAEGGAVGPALGRNEGRAVEVGVGATVGLCVAVKLGFGVFVGTLVLGLPVG